MSRRDEQMAAATISVADPRDAVRLRTYLDASAKSDSRAWRWYKEIPEVNYAIGRGADLAGHAKIYAYRRNTDGTPGEVVEDGYPAQLAASLYSPYGGVRHLIGSYFALRRVCGEAYLIRNGGGDPKNLAEGDGYDFVSPSELQFTDNGIVRLTMPVTTGSTSFTIPVRDQDMLGRVWNPSFRYVEVAQSPLDAVDVLCEELNLLTLGLKSKLLNRLALAGLMFIPSEMTEVVPANAPAGESDFGTSRFHTDIVIDSLIKSMVRAVRNTDEPIATLPIIIRGPGENGEQIQWITMDRAILETDMKLRAEAVQRILTGLDIQPETVSGTADTNHWGMWSVLDQDVKLNTEPDLQAGMWALNRLMFWPMMIQGREEGVHELSENDFMLWYDLSDAITPTNTAENARQASDRLVLSDAALRAASGFDDEAKPDDDEYVRQIGRKVGNAWLATYGMTIQGEIDWEEADKHAGRKSPGPNADSPAPDAPVGPGVGTPGSPDSNESDAPKADRPQ